MKMLEVVHLILLPQDLLSQDNIDTDFCTDTIL
jgi:hypothetical protein